VEREREPVTPVDRQQLLVGHGAECMVGQEGRAGPGATGTVGAHILLIGYVKGESVALKFHSRAHDYSIDVLNWSWATSPSIVLWDMAVSTVVVAAGYLIELFLAKLGFCRFGRKSIAHWKLPIVPWSWCPLLAATGPKGCDSRHRVAH
jgi:hypothetical protein